MPCPECGADAIAFSLPDDLRAHFPDDRPGGELCTRCLFLAPADDPPDDLPDFTAVSDAFPPDREHALTVVCLLALLDSVALYRSEIDALTDRAEAEGTDVLLVLDRLQHDDGVDPHFDLAKRAHQLEQLLR
jgi:hypothetical protein